MYIPRKLKPDRDFTGLLPAVLLLTLFIIVLILAGIDPALRILGIGLAVYAVFSIMAFLRTRSYGYLVSMLYVCSLAIFVNTMPVEYMIYHGELPVLSKLMAFITFFFLIWSLVLLVTGRTKWRGRDVFELAARDIQEVEDGYTSRPHPTGIIHGSKNQILDFAEFLERNLIVLSHVEEHRVVMAPVMMGQEFGHLFGRRKYDINTSWVAIDFDGHVLVNITRSDYLRFKENLSFNQLCDNMGLLFIDFFEMYKKGESIRILDRLNSMRIGIFS
jgi:hypothetical protein